jgi:hypothetical protein
MDVNEHWRGELDPLKLQKQTMSVLENENRSPEVARLEVEYQTKPENTFSPLTNHFNLGLNHCSLL